MDKRKQSVIIETPAQKAICHCGNLTDNHGFCKKCGGTLYYIEVKLVDA